MPVCRAGTLVEGCPIGHGSATDQLLSVDGIDDDLEIEQRFHAARRTIEDLGHDRGTIDPLRAAMILTESDIRISIGREIARILFAGSIQHDRPDSDGFHASIIG